MAKVTHRSHGHILCQFSWIRHWSPEQTGHQISQINWTFELFCALVGNFAHFFCFSFWAIFAPKTLTKRPSPSMQAIFFMKAELFEAMFLISFVLQGQIQDFFRRGCTRLLLYFNTNKPQFFFCRIPVVLENCRSSQGGGGAYPLHPPPRSAPVLNTLQFPLYYFVKQ